MMKVIRKQGLYKLKQLAQGRKYMKLHVIPRYAAQQNYI